MLRDNFLDFFVAKVHRDLIHLELRRHGVAATKRASATFPEIKISVYATVAGVHLESDSGGERMKYALEWKVTALGSRGAA